MSETYEPWLIEYVPQSGEVAIDIGANRGLWTRWLAARYKYVHAIEPNHLVLPDLKLDLPGNVTVHAIALWSKLTLLHFNTYACPDHLSAYFLDEGLCTGPVTGCSDLVGVPLDALAISGKVDFVKIDTEGAEYEIILGALNLIARNQPVILIEIHSAQLNDALHDLLPSMKYTVEMVEHPLLSLDSPMRKEHCWLACQPH